MSSPTEDCKFVVTCKMQNRNATDKLNQQCSKLALFANTISEICDRITMLVYYIVDQVHFYCILQVTTNLQSSVAICL